SVFPFLLGDHRHPADHPLCEYGAGGIAPEFLLAHGHEEFHVPRRARWVETGRVRSGGGNVRRERRGGGFERNDLYHPPPERRVSERAREWILLSLSASREEAGILP